MNIFLTPKRDCSEKLKGNTDKVYYQTKFWWH
jgi:hypothetical protein